MQQHEKVPRGQRAPSGGRQKIPASSAHRFRIELKGVRPTIWRRILVPSGYSFWEFHVAIQDAMGWFDSHLHAFQLKHPRTGKIDEIGIPDDALPADIEMLPGWEIPIADYFPRAGASAEYLYDFGDGWRHAVTLEAVEKVAKGACKLACLDGARACPPEDCGGVHGYARLLEAVRDTAHPEHDDMLEWLDRPFDPEAFDAGAVAFDDPAARFMTAFSDD